MRVTQRLFTQRIPTFPLNILIGTTFPCKSLTVIEYKSIDCTANGPKQTKRSSCCIANSILFQNPKHARRLESVLRCCHDNLARRKLFLVVKVMANDRRFFTVIVQSEASNKLTAWFQFASFARAVKKGKYIPAFFVSEANLFTFAEKNVAFSL